MRQALQEAVMHFRLGEEGAGSDALVRFIDAFSHSMTSEAMQSLVVELSPSIRKLLLAQQRGDFLYVADLLQYELGPKLSASVNLAPHD